jgi:hypothetical protein
MKVEDYNQEDWVFELMNDDYGYLNTKTGEWIRHIEFTEMNQTRKDYDRDMDVVSSFVNWGLPHPETFSKMVKDFLKEKYKI